MNYCIEVIIFYIKGYLNTDEFEDLLYDSYDLYNNEIEKSIFQEIICTNFHSKEQIIHLDKVLYEYIIRCFKVEYDMVNDAYIEIQLKAQRKDRLFEIIRTAIEPKECVEIDCSRVCKGDELIGLIINNLLYTTNCGHSWDAINDYIFDVVLPRKICFKDWSHIEKISSNDSKICKSILSRIDQERCTVTYE